MNLSSQTTFHLPSPLLYLCGDSPGAPGHPSGRRPWGLGHRNAGSACSVSAAPAAAAPDRPPAAVSGKAAQQHCGQILAPDRCKHYLLGSNDRQPPIEGRERERQTGSAAARATGRILIESRSSASLLSPKPQHHFQVKDKKKF